MSTFPCEGWQPGNAPTRRRPAGKKPAPSRTFSVGPTLDGAASLRKGIPLAGLRPDDDLRVTRHPHTPTLRCPRSPARVGGRTIAQPCAGPPGKKPSPSRTLSVGPALDGAASLRKGIPLAGLQPDDDLRGTRHPHTPTLRCPRSPARVGSRAIAQPGAGPPGKKPSPSRTFSVGPTLDGAASLRKGTSFPHVTKLTGDAV